MKTLISYFVVFTFLSLFTVTLLQENKLEYSNQDIVTFTNDIKPIFERACSSCHPGVLVYETAYIQKDRILGKVSARYDKQMPPSYSSMKLSENEVALIKEWVNTGARQ